jgi:hypothetical protein
MMKTDLKTVELLVAALKTFITAAHVHNAGIVEDTTCAVTFADAQRQAEAALLVAESPK